MKYIEQRYTIKDNENKRYVNFAEGGADTHVVWKLVQKMIHQMEMAVESTRRKQLEGSQLRV